MPFLEPHLSERVRAELDRGKEMHDFVMKSFPETIVVRDDRMNLFLAYFHLADDLFGSILHLLSAGGGADGGAFALVRPLVEACVMGQWLFFCASDENVERAHSGIETSPGLPNMMDALDREIGENVFAGLKLRVRTMHGFTHGGVEQLARRFDANGNLRANYPDTEKIELVRSMTAVFALATNVFFGVVADDPTTDTRTQTLREKYAELYGI